MDDILEQDFDNEESSNGGLPTEGFVIDNDYKAEWALKKIAEIDAEHKRLDSICEYQINYYKQKQAKYKEKWFYDRGGLVGMLAHYFEMVKSKATKTRATYSLPRGKLIKTFEKSEMDHDDAKLIELLSGTDYVENVPKLKWGEYKKTLKIVGDSVVDEDGVVIEGVSVKTKPASFEVEVEQYGN